MEFAASLKPCEACGDRAPLSWHSSGGRGVWRTHAVCPCGALRMYVYACDLDLSAVEPKMHALGGKEPSTILDVGELVAEVERLAPTLSPTDTSPDGWRRVDRALTALHELEKLARADRARRPWIREQQERCYAIRAQMLEVERAARGGERLVFAPSLPPSIHRETRRAHVAWLKRGRSGPGRMELTGARVVAEPFSAENVTAARLERVSLGHDVSFTRFDEAELVDCVVEGAFLSYASFVGATLTGCSLDRAHGSLVDLSRARIERCSFDDVAICEARWDGATVVATSFAGAYFGASSWKGATFRRCSFRGASWEPRREYAHESMAGARFEDCDFGDACFAFADLSGATFVRCRFSGAHGEPRREDGVVVTESEVSTEELLRALPRVHTIDELAERADSIVVACDRAAPDGSPLRVFSLERATVRRIGIVHGRREELAGRGLVCGATFGGCGFVWSADDASFRIWCREQSSVTVTRETLAWAGTIPTAAIVAVVSVVDADGRRCGVAIRTPSEKRPRSILVQAEGDPRWTRELARDLASWLRVPYVERGEPADGWG